MAYSRLEQKLITRALKLLESKLQTLTHTFLSPIMVTNYLKLVFQGIEREQFVVLFLNSQHQLIQHEVLFLGTINQVEVHPREVVKRALQHNAASVILAHNHPSGQPEPSQADKCITERLVEALAIFDVQVLDHIVVGHNSSVSFAERGWLSKIKRGVSYVE